MLLRDRRDAGPRRQSPSRWPIAGLVVFIALLGASLVWLYLKGEAVRVVTDPKSLCPEKPAAVLVILLDVSDEYSEPQRLALESQLARVTGTIPRFGLVEVYSVDRIGRRLTEPALHLCNPGTGADLSRIYQNPELAKKQWEGFAAALKAEIEREVGQPAVSTSPIFEAVQAAALRTFGRPEYDGLPKKLVLISDLIQNVPGELSMYQSLPDFETFKMTPYFSRVRAPLDGVTVQVLYLVRSGLTIQGRKHISFWEAYFQAQGAVVESVEKVFGDK